MTIAALTEDDWEVLQAIRLRALRQDPEASASSLERELGFKESHWRMRLRGSPWLVARVDGEPVGVLSVISEPGAPANERHLMAAWVAPEHRDAGVEDELIGAAEDRARADGATRMSLWIVDGDDAAQHLYARLGYGPSGVRMPAPRDRSRTEERWTKAL